jgi:CRP-like cAMP-binding protein
MPITSPPSSLLNTVPRTRAIADSPRLAARAVELLQGLRGFVRLDAQDARTLLPYLREVSFSRGELLFRAGDNQASAHLLLLLDGEVAVDTAAGGMPIAALGAGSVLGEMALLDGAPRSATCTAMSDVQAAGLARRGLERLIAEHPQVAVKLMAVLAQILAERLRALDEQLRMLGQVHAAGVRSK